MKRYITEILLLFHLKFKKKHNKDIFIYNIRNTM